MIFKNTKELSEIIKNTRKNQGITQADLALASGVGMRFIVDIEAGKPTCEIEKTIKVATMLGIKLEASIDGR